MAGSVNCLDESRGQLWVMEIHSGKLRDGSAPFTARSRVAGQARSQVSNGAKARLGR